MHIKISYTYLQELSVHQISLNIQTPFNVKNVHGYKLVTNFLINELHNKFCDAQNFLQLTSSYNSIISVESV